MKFINSSKSITGVKGHVSSNHNESNGVILLSLKIFLYLFKFFKTVCIKVSSHLLTKKIQLYHVAPSVRPILISFISSSSFSFFVCLLPTFARSRILVYLCVPSVGHFPVSLPLHLSSLSPAPILLLFLFLTHSRSHSRSLSHTLLFSHTLSQALSPTLALSHTLSLSLTHSRSLSHTLLHSLSHSHTLSHTLSLFLSHSLALSLSRTPSLALTDTHTHSFSHALSHSFALSNRSLTISYSHSHLRFRSRSFLLLLTYFPARTTSLSPAVETKQYRKCKQNKTNSTQCKTGQAK